MMLIIRGNSIVRRILIVQRWADDKTSFHGKGMDRNTILGSLRIICELLPSPERQRADI